MEFLNFQYWNKRTTTRRVNLIREPHFSPCDNESHPCGVDNLINLLGLLGPWGRLSLYTLMSTKNISWG
jgi:hypothetical protein